jgi:hypothetical protein
MAHFIPSTSQSPFLSKLPREVRDIIWDHLWQATQRIEQRYKRNNYTVTYDMVELPSDREVPAQLAAWLLTNKKIMDEGMFQLHQKSTWHFHDSRQRTKPYSYTFPLNIPSRAAAQHLYIHDWQSMSYSNVATPLPAVKRLVKQMIDTDRLTSAVKTIHITLCFLETYRYHILSNIGKSLKYDFSALDRLDQHKQLQEVRFCLMYQAVRRNFYLGPITTVQGSTPPYDDTVWERLAPELSRIGTELIEGGTEETFNSGTNVKVSGNHILKHKWPYDGSRIKAWEYSMRK